MSSKTFTADLAAAVAAGYWLSSDHGRYSFGKGDVRLSEPFSKLSRAEAKAAIVRAFNAEAAEKHVHVYGPHHGGGRNIRINVGDVRVLVESSNEREQEAAMAVARRIAALNLGGSL
jgi:hypothetical protein